jgi:uncharacterized membrane protein
MATATTAQRRAGPATPVRDAPRLPGFLLGLGLGGFVDGIVLHQVLQWHHMVSDTAGAPPTTLAGLEDNTLADGLFHLGSWVLVVSGVVLALRAWQAGRLAPSWRLQGGLLLAGWGAFNLVEGTVDHLLLGVHHVRDDLGGPLGWDLAFLALGAAQLLAGHLLVQRARRADAPARGPSAVP